MAELSGLVSGLPSILAGGGAVGLQSLQEFEQSLLGDLAASSFQIGEAREPESALQAVVLRLERLVSRRHGNSLGWWGWGR